MALDLLALEARRSAANETRKAEHGQELWNGGGGCGGRDWRIYVVACRRGPGPHSKRRGDGSRYPARAFEAKCSACHGVNAAGRDGSGPPLIHKIYEPSHHGDGAFLVAATNGVRQHHWSFGNMPPVEGITQAEVKSIVTYVREVQRANGID